MTVYLLMIFLGVNQGAMMVSGLIDASACEDLYVKIRAANGAHDFAAYGKTHDCILYSAVKR